MITDDEIQRIREECADVRLDSWHGEYPVDDVEALLAEVDSLRADLVGPELTAIAEQIEERANRGANCDRETEHQEADRLLLLAIRLLGKDSPAAGRIVDAWERGSANWWWA